jgi:Rad3-related DNA helicase
MAIVKAFPDKQVCILCPNNNLVQQYAEEYHIPYLIGKAAMDSEERAYARELVYDGASFVTNGAWKLHNMLGKWAKPVRPNIVVIDECDQVINYARNEQSTSYDIKTDNPFAVLEYLKRAPDKEFERAVFLHAMKRNQCFFMDVRDAESKSYLHYTYLDGLVARALKGTEKTILMSATLTEFDHQELMVPKNSRQIFDGAHPIPEERRPVVWDPKPDHYRENMRELALDIVDIYIKEGRKNTVVHVTYEDQRTLVPFLQELLGDSLMYNEPNKDSKQMCVSCLETRRGVLWLAAGVSEGVNLKNDMCRVQIIPWLIFPSIGDTFVSKRMTLADGADWYHWQACRHLLQAAGRCSRSETDYGVTYVFDPRLQYFRTTWRNRKLVPKWFKIKEIPNG